MKLWKRFLKDTYCLARSEYIDNILLALSSFPENINFTFEIESDNNIPLPDILIIRKPGKIETTVYRKRHVPMYIWIGILLRLKVGNGELETL